MRSRTKWCWPLGARWVDPCGEGPLLLTACLLRMTRNMWWSSGFAVLLLLLCLFTSPALLRGRWAACVHVGAL